MSVCNEGYGDVKRFFEALKKHKVVGNTDLKVLVVGLSEAGKTSLIKTVITQGQFLVRQGDRTVGIEQNTWTFEREDITEEDERTGFKNVNLLMYDFAGQQEYYITHHVRTSAHALVVSTRPP